MILDIALIAVIAISTYLGVKRGFVRSLCNLLSFALSIIVAMLTYSTITNFVAASPVGVFISGKLSESINSSAVDLSAFPEFLRKPLESGSAEIVDIVAQNLTALIIAVISVIITIVVVKFLLKLLFNALNVFAKLPVLKQCNGLLGCVFGFISGCFWACIIIIAITYLSYIPSAEFLKELIDTSNVAAVIADNSFVSSILAD